MRIGELAARADVSVRSLRYYEEQGLLTSSRSASGQRHYTEEDVERVHFLQRMYAAGLSSRAIAEVLPCMETPTTQTAATAFERLVAERDRIDGHIAELVATRDALERLIEHNRTHRAALEAAAPSST